MKKLINQDQKIFITGAKGFIGQTLIDYLKNLGYKNVIPLKNHKEIERDAVVVHLASSVIPGTAEKKVTESIKKDLAGTIALLEICKERKIRKLIFLSSGGTVYGEIKEKSNNEKSELSPINHFGLLKATIEKYISLYGDLYKTPYCIVRVGNVYGRKKLFNHNFGAVDVFIDTIKNGDHINIWGDGKTVRDYIHVDDTLSFIEKAIREKMVVGTYNVATGVGNSLNDLINIIEKSLKKKASVKYKPSRGLDVKHNVLDITKAKKTGWKPRYNIHTGVRKTIDDLK